MSEWIKCSERMPELGSTVLAYDGGVFEATLSEKHGRIEWDPYWLPVFGCGCCGGSDPEPTHWMPLPEPPKD